MEKGREEERKPVSDYIIALQDLKAGLRKIKRLKAAVLLTNGPISESHC